MFSFLLHFSILSLKKKDADASTFVACVGDSITLGSGASSPSASYPSVLQVMLGDSFTVKNFGKAGYTLTETDMWYQATNEFKAAYASEPDVVLIGLGTNDAKAANWRYEQSPGVSFVNAYLSFIKLFLELPSSPQILVLMPVRQLESDPGEWPDPTIINSEIPPLIYQVSNNTGIAVVAQHKLFFPSKQDQELGFSANPDLYDDAIHPNDAGYLLMAGLVAQHVGSLISRPTPSPYSVATPTPSPRMYIPSPTVHEIVRETTERESQSSSEPPLDATSILMASIVVSAVAMGICLGFFFLRKREAKIGTFDDPDQAEEDFTRFVTTQSVDESSAVQRPSTKIETKEEEPLSRKSCYIAAESSPTSVAVEPRSRRRSEGGVVEMDGWNHHFSGSSSSSRVSDASYSSASSGSSCLVSSVSYSTASSGSSSCGGSRSSSLRSAASSDCGDSASDDAPPSYNVVVSDAQV